MDQRMFCQRMNPTENEEVVIFHVKNGGFPMKNTVIFHSYVDGNDTYIYILAGD